MSTRASSLKSDGDKVKKRPKSPGSNEHDQLHKYVDDTRSKISLLKPKESASLLEKLAEVEKKLDSLKNTHLSTVESYSLVAEINEINQKAEKRNLNFLTRILPEQNEVAIELIKLISAVSLAVIGLIGAAGYKANTPPAVSPTPIPTDVENLLASPMAVLSNRENVAVLFENSNSIPVQVFIKNEADPKHNQSPIIQAGGMTTFKDLDPGEYTIEVRPIYPEMTLQASNCYVQWQQDDAYKGNLVLTSGETIIHINHFELQPQEICLTETPAGSTPTPLP
jgi:hypothetical protein